MLDRESILNVDDRPTRVVQVPEWGGEVRVRSMSGAARDEVDAAFLAGDPRGVKALVVALTACDESGALLFTREDVEALQEKNAVALERVFEAGWEVSGMGGESVDAAVGN